MKAAQKQVIRKPISVRTQTQDQEGQNMVKGVERLKMKFQGKKYDTQFTSTGKKKNEFMHNM